MKILKYVEKIIVRLNIAVMVLSLSTMIILGLIQIILRNFFDSGFTWADIIVRNLVLWVGFSGAVVATSGGRHIAIGALLRLVPPRGQRVARILVSLVSSVVCFFLSSASVKFVVSEREMGEMLFGGLPIWISELVIPATFIFLTYLFFIQALEAPQLKEGD